MNKESAYWIALAHLPRWGHLKIAPLVIARTVGGDLV